jgi:hypothetical protein
MIMWHVLNNYITMIKTIRERTNYTNNQTMKYNNLGNNSFINLHSSAI